MLELVAKTTFVIYFSSIFDLSNLSVLRVNFGITILMQAQDDMPKYVQKTKMVKT